MVGLPFPFGLIRGFSLLSSTLMDDHNTGSCSTIGMRLLHSRLSHLQLIVKLNQCDLSIVQMIGQYEFIITTKHIIRDYINGKVLVKIHVELFQPFYMPLYFLHISVHRFPFFQFARH